MSNLLGTLDRNEEALLAHKEMPEHMRRVVSHYGGFYAHAIRRDAIVMESTVRADALAKEWLRISESAEEVEKFNMPGVRYRDNSACMKGFHGELLSNDASFSGLSSKDLGKEIRGENTSLQEKLEKAREKLARAGLKEHLQEAGGFVRKRRRTLSEHDGDWDYDRKWDSTPFLTTKMDRKEFPFVEFVFPIGNSAGIDQSQISQFGARCLALAEIMEQAGYRVAITAEAWGNTMGNAYNSYFKELGKKITSEEFNHGKVIQLDRFLIREAGEYGDIQSLALFSSAPFYRRAIFSLNYNLVHYVHGVKPLLEMGAESGYGYPESERPMPLSPGQVLLNHSTLRTLFGVNKEEAARLFKSRVIGVLQSDKGEEKEAS